MQVQVEAEIKPFQLHYKSNYAWKKFKIVDD